MEASSYLPGERWQAPFELAAGGNVAIARGEGMYVLEFVGGALLQSVELQRHELRALGLRLVESNQTYVEER
jgi:hypothetical protein